MANEAHQLMRVRNWLAILLFVIVTLVIFAIGRSGPQSESRPVIRGHVKHLRKKLSELISENAKLREETMFLSSEARASVIQNANDLPTVQHERLVRKVGIDVRELGYYVTSRLEMSAANLAQLPRDINRTTTSTIDGLQQTLRQIKAYIRTTMVDLKSLSDPDSDWRQKESEHLSKMVQHRIHRIMNPADCNKKKKFICDLRVYCGFGCEFHHLLTCMVIAVYHRRPLLLLPTAGKLSGSVWERVFRPISDSCGNMSYDKFVKWEGDKTDHDAIIVPSANHFQEGQRYPPLAIPEEIAPRLTRLHGNPAVWWIGQLAKYLWKFQPQTSQYVDEVANKTGFKSPIVGIHVRRTDKLVREASSHAIQEYMTWVDEYYNEREMTEKIDKRRVFIATDEPNVILKARSLYPHYEVLNDLKTTKVTSSVGRRYYPSALLGIIADIELLVRSDFLVCTFSSNVCRLAYELLQARHGDASQHAHSLDNRYFFWGQRAHYMHAIEHHVPDGPGEMRLTPGDKILIGDNQCDGYTKGTNNGTVGLFPSYKVEDTIEVAAYPYSFLSPDENTTTDPHVTIQP